MNAKSLKTLPPDIIKEVLKKLPVGEFSSFKGIARFGRTCKSYHLISIRLIFERFIELEPSIIYDIRTLHGPRLVAWEFYFLQFPKRSWSIKTFEKIAKICRSDFRPLFKYIALGLQNNNPEKSNAVLSVLRFVLEKNWNGKLIGSEFVNYTDDIVQRLTLTFDEIFRTASHSNFCLFYIVNQKLVTTNSHCINSIIEKITDLINRPDCFQHKNTKSFEVLLYTLSKMFELTLVDTSLPNFQILTDRIASLKSEHSNQFFLDLCQINHHLKNTVLPRYNIPVTKAIFKEGCRQSWQYKTDELIALLKEIIDLEPSGDSKCCELIIKDINYILTRYVGETYNIFKELQYYIYYKRSWLPISWETYHWWYLE